ncbi:hypothetical protein PTKIN_Ptkin04bG0213400 [Pterospermum kingtungense]
MDQNQNQIHHFLHPHPLELTELDEANIDVVVCSGCQKGFQGPIYMCSDCKFYLHISCAQLQREIQNYYHPCPLVLTIEDHTYCNFCFSPTYGFSYSCKKCNCNMHVNCALKPVPVSYWREIVFHFCHWHYLSLTDPKKKDFEVRCHICDKLSSSSPIFGCDLCMFFVHHACMINIPRQINHFLHPSCPLVLLIRPRFRCEGCGNADYSGLSFSCGGCGFHLDVKCALICTAESEDGDKSQHTCHRYPLAPPLRCRACGENCSRPSFASDEQPCAVEFPPQIHHPFHPLHPLTLCHLEPQPNLSCHVCRRCPDRSVRIYHCDKCDFNLHTHCAKPKEAPYVLKTSGVHSHFLTFFDRTRTSFVCHICFKKALNCFFRCVACDFNIHLYCHPSAPKTIKHKYHIHPLTLATSPFEFEFISSEHSHYSNDDFYCDVCEEKRFKFESVYYCEECRFIAEVRCVLSEVLPTLTDTEEQSTAKGRAISDDDEESSIIEATIAKRNSEMAMLREKEKALEEEIEKLQAKLQALEKDLKPIESRLKELETDRAIAT